MTGFAEKIKTARDAGYNDDQIVEFLGKTDPRVNQAREAGYRGGEILKFLETGKGYDRSGGPVNAALRGVYQGLENIAALPGNLAGGAAEALGLEGASGAGTRFVRRFKEPAAEAYGKAAEAITGMPFDTNIFKIDDRTQLPPEERPFAAGGQFVGESIPFALAPIAAASRVAPAALAKPGAPPGIVKNIVNSAARDPRSFAALEAGAIAGGAQGAAAAEALFPGNPTAAFVGEMGGALINPIGATVRGGRGAVRSIRDAASGFTPGGKEGRAAQYIQEIVRDVGEDPEALARALRQEDLLTPNITSAQKTGSPSLLALEAKMGEKSARFRSEVAQKGETGLEDLRRAADALASSGDPQALAAAAKTRQRYFDRLLDSRIRDAEAQAIEARLRLGTDTRGDRGAISSEAFKTLEDALRQARTIERDLWAKVPRGEQVQTSATQQANQAARESLLPTETLQNPVEAYVRTLSGRNDVTVGELLTLRSRALELARSARAQGDWTTNRSMMTIADGVLDDLATVPGGTADIARQFSRSLHDRFTRTFAGDALGESSTGAQRIPPEVMLERAFGGGGTRADVRFGELSGAMPDSLLGDMLSAQERFLRTAARDSIDPNTGEVNPRRLETFLRNNDAVLERFPELRAQLQDATQAERVLKEISAANLRASKAIQQRAVFSKLLDTEDPARVVGSVIRGSNPARDYSQLVRLAKRSGEGAIGGLRAATIDDAMKRATTNSGDFSFDVFREAMTKPPVRGTISPLEMMRRNGVVNPAQANQMETILTRAEKLEAALRSGQRIDQVIGEPDALTDLVVRIAGARMGAQGGVGASGSTLVAAQRGSAFARNLFQKVPATRINDVIVEALNNPKLMAALLEKPTNIGRRRALDQQINAALISAGLVPEDE